MEKKEYEMVKAMKAFRFYVFHSKISAYVPHTIVKDILYHTDSEGRRRKWITEIQEYDL